jgi:hypothetical protein
MDVPSRDFVLAGSLEELKAKGRLVLHGGAKKNSLGSSRRPRGQVAFVGGCETKDKNDIVRDKKLTVDLAKYDVERAEYR